MLTKNMAAGMRDACAKFGVDFDKLAVQVHGPAPGASLWGKAKAFGGNQMDAGRSLWDNARDAFKGPGASRDTVKGNLKTLAPSLALAGGAYMLHRNSQAKERERQQQQMAQRPY